MKPSKETSYGKMITAAILFSTVMMIEGSQQFHKALDRPLSVDSECSDTSQSHWFINNEQVPPQWVQSNGNLVLPANDWRAYGIVTNKCGSIINSYKIVSLGDQCTGCLLQYFTPNRGDMCVGDVLTVTLSTNQSQPHESVFTLNVNSNVCNSGGGGGGIVSCREEEGNVTHHTAFSYYITALNPGIANIQGHTLYFGGEWYSITMTVTIRRCRTEGNTTNATPSNITTDATPPTTEQTPPAENGSGDDYGNQPPPTGDVPPSSVPAEDKEDNDTEIIILAICTILSLLATVAIIIIIVYKCWKKITRNKNHSSALSMEDLPANYGVQVAEGMSLPQREESSAVADGREQIQPLPRSNVMGLVEEYDTASSKASQESQC